MPLLVTCCNPALQSCPAGSLPDWVGWRLTEVCVLPPSHPLLQMSVSLMVATLLQRCRFRPLRPNTQLIPTACEGNTGDAWGTALALLSLTCRCTLLPSMRACAKL